MSNIFRTHQRKIIGVAVAAGMCGLVRFHPLSFHVPGMSLQKMRKYSSIGLTAGALTFFNPFRTPAVSAIEDRYSSGGASRNHTPGVATPRGKIDQVHGNQEKHAGIGTPEWDEKIGGQKPNVSSLSFLEGIVWLVGRISSGFHITLDQAWGTAS